MLQCTSPGVDAGRERGEELPLNMFHYISLFLFVRRVGYSHVEAVVHEELRTDTPWSIHTLSDSSHLYHLTNNKHEGIDRTFSDAVNFGRNRSADGHALLWRHVRHCQPHIPAQRRALQ